MRSLSHPIQRPGAPAASYPSSCKERGREGKNSEELSPALVESSPSETAARKSGGNVFEQKGRWGEIWWMPLLPNFSLLCCRCGILAEPLSSRPQFPHKSNDDDGLGSQSPKNCFHQSDIQIPRHHHTPSALDSVLCLQEKLGKIEIY